MAGFFGVMLVLMSLAGLMFYWASWEVQHQETRAGFTTNLWNNAVRLIRWAPLRIATLRKQSRPARAAEDVQWLRLVEDLGPDVSFSPPKS